jgi:ParB family chromosome partitioning protein
MLDNNPESPNKKRGLGRGLGSLLGGAVEAPAAPATEPAKSPLPKANPAPVAQPATPSQAQVVARPATAPVTATIQKPAVAAQPPVSNQDRIWKIAIDKLNPGQFQPRQEFGKESLQELSASIKANGILQPIVARKKGDKFEIIAGERRWRAAQMAGHHEVPVILKEFKDQQALELALVENIQREDLNPVEEAEAYQRLIQEFSLSQQQVADKVGKDRATVANSVRLLSLPTEVLKMITDQTLTVGHAKVLLSLPDKERQMSFAKQTVKEKLSVRKLEKMIQTAMAPAETPENKPGQIDENVMGRLINGISEELQKMLGTKVDIDYAKGKGKISIHFYSDEELSQTVERLKKL